MGCAPGSGTAVAELLVIGEDDGAAAQERVEVDVLPVEVLVLEWIFFPRRIAEPRRAGGGRLDGDGAVGQWLEVRQRDADAADVGGVLIEVPAVRRQPSAVTEAVPSRVGAATLSQWLIGENSTA